MLLLLVLFAAPAAPPSPSALVPTELVASFGPLQPQMGAWVEYLVRSRGEQDVRIRVAVIPPLVPGRVWVEVAALGAQSLPFAARLLLNATTGKLEHASVYALGQAPIEVPVGDGKEPVPMAKAPAGKVHTRAQTVSVPAGRFTATELRVREDGKVARIWRTDEVPLFGVVRVVRRHQEIELVRYGHAGARSFFPPLHGNGSERANE
jgi:hypothetical protein